jgi:ribosomal protein S18 acetylase RimI-like enzyme
MSAAPDIVALRPAPTVIAGLADTLVEAVAHGASVSFLHPLARETAAAFWTKSLAAAAAGERVVLGAVEAGEIAGTVTLHLDTPQNQPHRGEIAKLMTRVHARGRGIGRALMLEAERIAREHGRTLLTLDTAAEEGAGPFYEKLGFERAGIIPDYAFQPFGRLSATVIYFKRIGAS